MNGVPVPVVAHLLGHANTSMTLRYAHVGDWDTQVAAERVGTAMAAALTGTLNLAANSQVGPTTDNSATGSRKLFPARLTE